MSDITEIVTADHQAIYRGAVNRLLNAEADFRVVGEAGAAAATIDLVRRHRPAVLVINLEMPGDGALEVLTRLASMEQRVRTIALTSSIRTERLTIALQLGVGGVVCKESPGAVLIDGIRRVTDNQSWVDREDGRPFAGWNPLTTREAAPHVPAPVRLTRREMDVVTAVVAGESNRAIGDRLSIKENTVKHHLSKVFGKLGVISRVQLALFAIRHRLVTDVEKTSSRRTRLDVQRRRPSAFRTASRVSSFDNIGDRCVIGPPPHTSAGEVSAVAGSVAHVVQLRRATPLMRADCDGRRVIDAAALTAQ